MNRRLLWLLRYWLLATCCASAASAQVNMPDPSAIAGTPLPAPELPDRTVTVRVVRERMGNNIAGQAVTLKVGSDTRTGTTDAQGRAQFDGLSAGALGAGDDHGRRRDADVAGISGPGARAAFASR